MLKFRDRIFLFRKSSEGLSAPRRVLYYVWQYGILFLLSACLGASYFVIAYSGGSWNWIFDYLRQPKILVFNLIPVIFLVFLFYGIIGRAWIAFAAGGVLSMLLPLGNYYKLAFRNDPVVFEDLFSLREANAMVTEQSYSLFLDRRLIAIFLALILGTVLLALFVRHRRMRLRTHIFTVIITLLIAACTIPLYLSDAVYDSIQNYENFNQWNQTEEFVSHGCWYPFLHSITEFMDRKPEGYSEEDADAILSEYEDADIPEDRKVNVIAVMREAYADFSQFDIDGLNVSAYDTYHAMQAESYTGKLVVNIFAGGTIDTERAFLTGNSSLRNYRGPVESYVWYLRNQGYDTSGIHPYYQWFYNRENVNPYLGFSSYRYYEDDFENLTTDSMPKDSLLYEELYSDYRSHVEENDAPVFSFSVTVQSHGPYATSSYDGSETYLTGDYSEACINAFSNYMDTIYDCDQALYTLMNHLREDEEPVILLVFSDHLPWMGDANVFYDELGINISLDSEEGFYNHYSTEYLIWANDAAKDVLGDNFTGTGPSVSPCFLMNVLFERLGWEGDSYMQAMNDIMDELPVITTTGYFVSDGELLTSLPETQTALYTKFQYLEYHRNHVFSAQ